MRYLGFAVWLLWAQGAWAQQLASNPVQPAWDPSVGAASYTIYVDGQPTVVGNPLTTIAGMPTILPLPMTFSIGLHGMTVSASNAGGESVQAPAPPLAFRVVQQLDPNCAAPLGNRVVTITPTALQKTGSKGAGSQARLDFRVQSPSSPVVHVAVRASRNGEPPTDLMVMDGANLGALAGMWFTLPSLAGTYSLAIQGTNLYGCTANQGTIYSVTIP